MAQEPADVLIIGAGASGGVVAKRLAEAGFGVVCLEQGEWLDRADYPGNKIDWELKARKDWATSPNIRGLAQDYPIVEDDTPVSPLMYNAVGGSTIIFAGAWPRALPSDFRVRSLDGVADDWPIDYFELLPYFYRTDRDFGVSGLPGDPAYPPDTEDAPMPPLPIGSAGLKVARGMTKLGWHWWPEFNSINSVAYDGRRPCVQRSTCQSGCNEGAKASTDLTHWPKAIAKGARLVTGARVRRIETDAKGLATGATWIDRDGAEEFQPAKVVVVAANAIGTPRLLLLSASPQHPDGLANSSGLVGKRLMMHPFANVAGLFEDPLMSWQGQFGDLIESLEFYETDEKRGFVRGARWGLAPTGGPINTALPSRAGEQIWGADHHAHVRTHLGHGANWGLFAEDLPDEANHITLSPTVTDSSGIPAPEVHYSMADNARRMLDFHIERATESMDAAGAYKIEVDRLMRYSGWHLLGTARMGDDPETICVGPLEPGARRPEPVRRRRLVLRHVVGGEPDVDDRVDRSSGGRSHGRDPLRAAGAGMTLDDGERATLAAIADHFIPAADGMPSAAEVLTDDRLDFVVRARPDLAEPLKAALRPDLGPDVRDRLATLAGEPTNLSALQLSIVGGYYTDRRVRELIGYPGQVAIELRSWEYPVYLEEGLIDAVLARGPVWRDPATGRRAVVRDAPRTYAERYSAGADAPEGGA